MRVGQAKYVTPKGSRRPATIERNEVTQLGDLIRKVSEYVDDDLATTELIQLLEMEPNPLQVARPALRAFLAQTRRMSVLSAERSVSSSLRNTPIRTFDPNTTSVPLSPVNVRVFASLLHETIKVPGAGNMTWGDLTLMAIESRIATLRGKMNGLRETMNLLENAHIIIRRSGTKTLAEAVELAA